MSLDGFEGGISFADLSFFSWRSLSAAVSATLLSMSFMFETGIWMGGLQWSEWIDWLRWLFGSGSDFRPPLLRENQLKLLSCVGCQSMTTQKTTLDGGQRINWLCCCTQAHDLAIRCDHYDIFPKFFSFFYKEQYSLHTGLVALKIIPQKGTALFSSFV